MQATYRSPVLKILVVAVALLAFGILHSGTIAASTETAPTLPDGITFSGDYAPDDIAYFQANLQLMRDQLPAWWQHVMDARPFTLDVDQSVAKSGIVAITECRNANRACTVKFGYHLAELPIASDTDSQSAEARRITFLGVLAHELTHVRDVRAQRFPPKTDRKTCIAVEASGLSTQLEIKRDLTAALITGDASAAQVYAVWLPEQVRSETRDLRSRSFWDWYCSGFD